MSKLHSEDLADMQRLILGGLGKYRVARYCIYQIVDVVTAQKDLKQLMAYVATADRRDKRTDKNVNSKICIAITWTGLQKFGLNKENLNNVPLAFEEGMGNEIRAKRLQDKPEGWAWSDARGITGAQDVHFDQQVVGSPVHVLIALFSKVDDDQQEYSEAVKQQLDTEWEKVVAANVSGMSCVLQLPDGMVRGNSKGHFGFRDGISQPYIEGSGTSRKPRGEFAEVHTLKPGEFILGHRNEFAQQVPPLWIDIKNVVSVAADNLLQFGLQKERRDFGRNGSYLVFRQIQQFPKRFSDYVIKKAKQAQAGEIDHPGLIAAKIVGRWCSGAPLTLSPDRDDPAQGRVNDFLYSDIDRHGLRCPVGSHVRRSFPRDTSPEQNAPIGSNDVLVSNRRRRLIRRGRPYHVLREDDVLDEDEPNLGLHFIALNADIREQFEFVQETWINNSRFGSTHGEVDPLVGANSKCRHFTIQQSPVSQRLSLVDFTKVIGGGYFFLPSIRALKFLSTFKISKD